VAATSQRKPSYWKPDSRFISAR